jgi:hypothetical protein
MPPIAMRAFKKLQNGLRYLRSSRTTGYEDRQL